MNDQSFGCGTKTPCLRRTMVVYSVYWEKQKQVFLKKHANSQPISNEIEISNCAMIITSLVIKYVALLLMFHAIMKTKIITFGPDDTQMIVYYQLKSMQNLRERSMKRTKIDANEINHFTMGIDHSQTKWRVLCACHMMRVLVSMISPSNQQLNFFSSLSVRFVIYTLILP